MTMLRERLFSPFVQKELQSEWRGRDISRVEGFSDAVFGFALSSAQARASPDDQHHSLG
jgi:hypothetical protein